MERANEDDPTIGEMEATARLAEPYLSDELVDNEPVVLGPVSPEDDIIARARGDGKTHKEAGALVNRSERTVRRRMQNPAVRRLCEEYRWENRDRFVAMVDAAAPKAVETGTADLDSDDPNIRRHARRDLLNTAVRLSAWAEPSDPEHLRAVYSALLSNYIQACMDVVPFDVVQQVLSRINDVNAMTELLAVEEEPIANMKIVIEKLDPSEAPKEYWEADPYPPGEQPPDLEAGSSPS